jgi:hypothetical protein
VNGFLVLAHTRKGDYPLRLCATRDEALRFINRMTVDGISNYLQRRHAHSLFADDVISILEFCDGEPMGVEDVWEPEKGAGPPVGEG